MATKAKGKYFRRKVRHPVTGAYRDVYGKTRAELADKCAELEALWAQQVEDESSPYVYQYAAEWFGRVSGDLTPEQREDVAREINSVICPVIGEKRLAAVTSDDVLDVMATRSGKSRSSQSKTLSVMKRLFRAAANAGKIPRSPAEDLKPGGKAAGPKKALTEAQSEALLAAVAGLPVEIFVRLGLFAGLRREEICGLAWKDVHLDGEHPHLDVRQACRWPHNNKPEIAPVLKSAAAWRTVPIPPPLAGILSSAREKAAEGRQGPPEGRTVVCTSEGEPWSYQTLRRAWGAVEARTAGTVTVRRKDKATGEIRTVEVERRLGESVPRHPDVVVSLDFDVTPHELRHTYITRLILAGVNVKRVQYLAGHETSAMTMEIYAHYFGHDDAALYADVAGAFGG